MNNENKIKHLEMVQDVIKRMASNSFILKGWAVALVAGIMALAEKDADKMYFLVAYIPIIVFWLLDSYYLLQERLYRELYNKVRSTKENDIDFSLSATKKEFGGGRNTFWACFISPTKSFFYLPLALVCAGVIYLTIK